ncbi:MAG: hypothetical protein SFV52_15730 [Saprospiraceae bacterium]|nr:hypothetical protein [Saprospiraceae bacterium]
MAKPTITLIAALRDAAGNLRNGAAYAWGHHGQCNCGNLIQVVTDLDEREIFAYAQQGAGEWTELATAWCPASQAPVDMVLHKLMDLGLTPTDVHHLEYLSDKKVLAQLPGGFRWLRRNRREDVIAYFEAYADVLENRLLDATVREALAETLAPAMA